MRIYVWRIGNLILAVSGSGPLARARSGRSRTSWKDGPSVTQTSVVTGGAGFIGSNLVHALLLRGDRVRVFDDLSTGRGVNLDDVGSDVELMHGDVRDTDAVARAVEGAAVVFHQAAIPSVARSVVDPMSSNDVNVGGTLNVLVAARDSAVERVVFASSAAVYGNADTLPLGEGMPTRPASPYGVSKLAGERYLEAFTRSYGLPTVALRYLNVYGPRQNPHSEYAAAARFISCTLGGEAPTVFGDGEQARDFVFVDDVVRANLLAAAAPEPVWGRAFNIGRGERRTVQRTPRRRSDARSRGAPGAEVGRRHGPARCATAGATSARHATRSATARPSGSRTAWVERSIGSCGNEPRTCGNVEPIADARVSELADDSDLKSLALRSVWVRVPPRALRALRRWIIQRT